MNVIILEDRYNTHQKITFLLYIGAPFILAIFGMLQLDLNSKGYIALIVLILIYLFLVSTAFLKRGFIKIDSTLFRGSFFLGKLIFKKKIDISKTPKLAVLKFKKSQKLAFFSAARPDLAAEFNSFEINLLNEKHTKRTLIFDLKNKDNVEPAIAFLTSNFDLKNEVYSPKFN